MASIAKEVNNTIKSEQVKIPNEYLCPISQQLMIEPMIAHDGFTYEKEEIELWFAKNKRSPKTNAIIDDTNLIPNNNIKNLIGDFFDANPDLYNQEDDIYLPKAWSQKLTDAIINNQLEPVKQLLKKHKKLLTHSLPLEGNYLAFHLACQLGSPELVDVIFTKLRLANKLEYVLTKLPPALEPKHLHELIKRTLQKVAPKIDERAKQLEKAKLLLQQIKTPALHLAIELDANVNTSILTCMLNNGIGSMLAIDQEGNNVLHLALLKGFNKATELLLERNIDPTIVTTLTKSTPLHIAVTQNNIEMVKRLLIIPQVKANINTKDSNGNTALHKATTVGHDDIVELLILNNSDYNSTNAIGKTPKALAQDNGHMLTVTRFIQITKTLKLQELSNSSMFLAAQALAIEKSQQLILANYKLASRRESNINYLEDCLQCFIICKQINNYTEEHVAECNRILEIFKLEPNKQWLQNKAQNDPSGDPLFVLGVLAYKESNTNNIQICAEAEKYLVSSAEFGNALAMNFLGAMHHRLDQKKAIVWYAKSAQLRYAPAIYNLGILYEKQGYISKAIEHYKQAENLLYTPAINRLAILGCKNMSLNVQESKFEMK